MISPSPGDISLPFEADDEIRRGKVILAWPVTVYLNQRRTSVLFLQVGGRHVWHQDYGYWYENGCLTPDMGSVFIALDPCTKENGCLRVLSGSHKMGRLDHVSIGNQDEQGEAGDLFRV